MAGAAPQGMIWMYNINELNTRIDRTKLDDRAKDYAYWIASKRVRAEIERLDEEAKAKTGTGLTDTEKKKLKDELTPKYEQEELSGERFQVHIRTATLELEQRMRSSYISTLFHESAHTLHEERAYPPEYDKLSALDYQKQDAFSYWWRNGKDSRHAGFVSDYASTDADEDFAELFATYVLSSEGEWNELLAYADAKIRPSAKYTGKEIILQKLAIMKQYIRDEYHTDLDAIRQKALEKLYQIPYKDFTQYPAGY